MEYKSEAGRKQEHPKDCAFPLAQLRTKKELSVRDSAGKVSIKIEN